MDAIESAIATLVVIALLVGSGRYMYLADSRNKAVANVVEAGSVITAAYKSAGFIAPPESTVETSTGVFHVFGSFQVQKGNRLTIETRADGSQYLCDSSPKKCFAFAE